MNTIRICRSALSRLAWLLLAVSTVQSAGGAGMVEEKFPLLQTRTGTYTNVTVTKKTRTWIFIMHSRGMGNIQISDLPLDVQQQLGYATEPQKNKAAGAASAAYHKFADTGLAQINALRQMGSGVSSSGMPRITLDPQLIYTVLAVVFLIYLFVCYCNKLICEKAGYDPGLLIWLPILQIIPMLRAAGMSGWWFLAYFVPVLNVLAPILLAINIVKARGKSLWVTFFLLLPGTNFFAFLYLAFSRVPAPEPVAPKTEIMTLETA